MVNIDDVVVRILRERATASEKRGLLVGISGIDASGKGYVARQIEARLHQHKIAAANIKVDGWLNLPDRRFSPIRPAEHFYENAIRFNDLFSKLLLPLKDHRSVHVDADFTEETPGITDSTRTVLRMSVLPWLKVFSCSSGRIESILIWPFGLTVLLRPLWRVHSGERRKGYHPPKQFGPMRRFTFPHRSSILSAIVLAKQPT